MKAPRFALGVATLASLTLAACGGGSTSIPDSADGTMPRPSSSEIQKGNAARPVGRDAGQLPEGRRPRVVHSFGKKMDAEVHMKGAFGVLEKVRPAC